MITYLCNCLHTSTELRNFFKEKKDTDREITYFVKVLLPTK